MPDPVSTVATQQVTQAATADAGGGFFNDLISSPWRLIKGLFSGVVNVPVGILKGIFSNTIGNPFGVLTNGAIVAVIAKFAPDIIKWLPLKFGDKSVGEIMGEHASPLNGDGFPGLVRDSLIAGVATSALVGAGKGALGGVAESFSSDDPNDTAGKIGGSIGGIAAAGGLAFLAYNALKNSDIGFVGAADTSGSKTPDKTPLPAEGPASKVKG